MQRFYHPDPPDRVLLSVDVPGEDLSPLIEAGNPDLLQLHAMKQTMLPQLERVLVCQL